MTKEDKNLLLKDLCARLPYGVKVNVYGKTEELLGILDDIASVGYDINDYDDVAVEDIKPYLRPMTSMTEEEKTEIGNFAAAGMFTSQNMSPLFGLAVKALYGDFFEKRHIDYRGLIPMGLALEAPEDMYK